MFINTIRDTAWLRSSMLANNAIKNLTHKRAATFTMADLKFTDTYAGGSLCINPVPQFTPSADPRRPGLGPAQSGHGLIHSEMFDDHYQTVHFRFGHASFSPLTFFLNNFYDPRSGMLARTGRTSEIMYQLGRAAGFVVSSMTWKLRAISLIGSAFAYFSNAGSSRFYTLKPAMPSYWQAVQGVMDMIAINLGIAPRVMNGDKGVGPNAGYVFDAQAESTLGAHRPRIFTKRGSLDVYRVAGRAQRMARAQIEVGMAGADNENMTVREIVSNMYNPDVFQSVSHRTLKNYLDQWQSIPVASQDPDKVSGDKDTPDMESVNALRKDDGRFLSFLENELDDGSAFASFRVNYTGPVQTSFSNQVGESEMASKLNNFSSSARSMSFDLSGGNIVPGMADIMGGIKAFVEGAAGTIGLGGIVAALTGGTFVDMPLQWKSSTANLPTSSYTMLLTSPNNNAVSQLINIYLPLSMLLAAALPLSTGRQSYTAPFLLEYYDQGRSQSKLGIIDSLSIRHGAHNLGFNRKKRPLGIEVTINITDLSTIMHIPISQGSSMLDVVTATLFGGVVAGATEALSGFFDGDTVFTEWLGGVTGLSMGDQIYSFRKFKMQATRELMKWDQWTNPARAAMFTADTIPGRLLAAFYTGSIRQ